MQTRIYRYGQSWKPFLAVLFAAAIHLWFTPYALGDEQCLRYIPETVTIKGVLKEEILPGPPDYSSIEDGDKPAPFWFIYPDTPVCVYGETEDDPMAVEQRNVTKLHIQGITELQYKRDRGLIGRRVAITGDLVYRIYMSQKTDLLIFAYEIKLAQ